MSFELAFPDDVAPVEGEQTLARYPANRRQSANRAVGGTLWLTSHRMLFLPIAFDARLGGRRWSTTRGTIADVEIVGTKWLEVFSGGLRKRLKVKLRDGGVEIFVVGQLWVPGQLHQIAREVKSWNASSAS
ncbi:hypothetical protein [Saccharomonospora iraqiensis]|uniref:hypothetical protein n=1 Tax=Saccharomonospora iraqiensis TaxID=52698 RepID=UPI0012B533CF|nr:hypothetical protein [Saccharomonospora iraqiensis]